MTVGSSQPILPERHRTHLIARNHPENTGGNRRRRLSPHSSQALAYRVRALDGRVYNSNRRFRPSPYSSQALTYRSQSPKPPSETKFSDLIAFAEEDDGTLPVSFSPVQQSAQNQAQNPAAAYNAVSQYDPVQAVRGAGQVFDRSPSRHQSAIRHPFLQPIPGFDFPLPQDNLQQNQQPQQQSPLSREQKIQQQKQKLLLQSQRNQGSPQQHLQQPTRRSINGRSSAIEDFVTGNRRSSGIDDFITSPRPGNDQRTKNAKRKRASPSPERSGDDDDDDDDDDGHANKRRRRKSPTPPQAPQRKDDGDDDDNDDGNGDGGDGGERGEVSKRGKKPPPPPRQPRRKQQQRPSARKDAEEEEVGEVEVEQEEKGDEEDEEEEETTEDGGERRADGSRSMSGKSYTGVGAGGSTVDAAGIRRSRRVKSIAEEKKGATAASAGRGKGPVAASSSKARATGKGNSKGAAKPPPLSPVVEESEGDGKRQTRNKRKADQMDQGGKAAAPANKRPAKGKAAAKGKAPARRKNSAQPAATRQTRSMSRDEGAEPEKKKRKR
ncbi:hypothetical protein SLS58_008469 [Diplodia intermedia]|uniref:Uncharacterized protein n=1 Tax=Diplodia intermedia TaxID=856260 RepID=A0ABR3TH86_9PEZI